MAWYYMDGEQEVGPVEKSDLQALIKSKQISGKTLVRSDNSDEWKPLAEMVRPKSKAAAEEAAPPSGETQPEPDDDAPSSGLQMENPDLTGDAPPAPPAPPAQATSVCSQCGRSFPNDQVLTYDGQVICAACKPMFVQKLKEGVGVGGTLRYAGFWIRFVAKFIDGIIMAIVQWVILIPLSLMGMGSFTPGEGPSAGFYLLMVVQQLVGILIPAVYNTFFIGKFAATPGKMACRLKVVTAENEDVSYMRALGRNFAEWLSAIILLIGYIMAGFDSEKRALHDRICNTRVVHK